MKIFHKCILLILIIGFTASAQNGVKEIHKENSQSLLYKPQAIEDRAGGTHNASNIGLFFENRGKLYPRRLTQGPSGEFPINSGKHYIYRINPMVGVPNNVIQGRYTTNEEWEAVGGYQNPEYTKIAFSDNPRTWHPDLGWPVKDAEGNPVIKSDQDSYCVYDDANNAVKKLGINIVQTGYTYGVKFAQNILFYKFDVTNQGSEDLDSLYFAMYCDMDIGNVSGGVPEYGDDFVGFDKANNFLYFYDDGFSTEWPGGTTGQMGVAFLKTPEQNGVELGITDMHYNLYDYDTDQDALQYSILSSDTSFLSPASFFGRFFHPGTANDLHYDDPATISSSGMDILATISSGPYNLNIGDTLTFHTAIVAGNNHNDLMENLTTAYKILSFNYEASKPPATPTLSAVAGDGRVLLYWDDKAEYSRDNFSGEYDFEGYRLYKSVDKGLHWDQYDRNVDPSVGIDPVPVADFDVINNMGIDNGIQYSYVDSTVTNEFEYWYSLTAYDRGDSTIESLECARGATVDALNTISVTPSPVAINRFPVSGSEVTHFGNGISNYVMTVHPVDNDSLTGHSYETGFTYTSRTDRGRLKTQAQAIISDSTKTQANNYGFEFIAPNRLNLIDLSTGDYIGSNPKVYSSGLQYTVVSNAVKIKLSDPDPNAPAEDLPKKGDYISVNFSTFTTRDNADTVIAPRPLLFNKPQSTSDGVIFEMYKPEIIQSVIRESGSDQFLINFSVNDEASVQNNIYMLSVEGNGFDTGTSEGYISLIIRDSAVVMIDSLDTLYNNDEFVFNGISARVQFDSNNPPAPGNVFSITTIIPSLPSLLDKYGFSIEGSYYNNSQISSAIKNIKVVPNPYVVGSLYEEEFGELRREPIRKLKFINLPAQCTIHIFSVAGDLIKTLYHEGIVGSATWDLRAEGGREVAPGIYIYVVKANGNEYMNRFAIIK